MNAGVILFLIFAVCVLIGVPISMSLGIGSLAAVALGNLGVSPAVIAPVSYTHLTLPTIA